MPEASEGPCPGVVVCHPHPALGDGMDHPLVIAICRATEREGIASLRFNFRGVGASEEEFTTGEKEGDDLRAAFAVLKTLPGVDRARLAVAGYSFGASVVLEALSRLRPAIGLAMVAPPLSVLRKSPIAGGSRPKLFVAGQRDRVAPSVELQSVLDSLRPPVEFQEVPTLLTHLPGTRRPWPNASSSF